MKKVILFVVIFSLSGWGIGARPLSMGGAFVAVADDIHSIFYNPAGIANIKEMEASSMRVLNNRDSMNFKEWIAISNGIKEGGMGGAYLHSVDWLGYADLDSDGIEDGNEPYLALDNNIAIFTIGGYGQGMLKKTGFGVNIRRYSESLMKTWGIETGGAKFKETGSKQSKIGVDIGILHNFNKNISFGFAIYDLNEPKFTFENLNIEDVICDITVKNPLTIVGGIALKPDDKTIFAMDFFGVNNINDWYSKDENDTNQSSIRLGFEREVLPYLFIRGGFCGKSFNTAGIGIKTKNIRLDYGLMEDNKGLGFHLVSLTINK
ncbi:MAG: hypothetical protein AB1630_02870 [bacterium]